MKAQFFLMLVALAAWAPGGASAQMFKCLQADGQASFQQMPCSEGQVPALDDPPAKAATPGAASPARPAADPSVPPTRRARELLELTAWFERCRRDQPGFAEKSGSVYVAWQRRHGAVLGVHERLLATKVWAARYGAAARPLHLCTEDWLRSIEALARTPDDRFSSVEKTWTVFLNALRAADRATALSCLTGQAQARWQERADKMTDDELRRIGGAFKAFKVQWGDDYMKEALASREDNRVGAIAFSRNVNEEWRISEL